jgi:4-hydroxy-2-oxoheptanedioate aldolase
MRANNLRRRWKDGDGTVNGWLTIPSSLLAETLAHQDFDSLTLDMQHGHLDYDAAWGILTAISTTETVPIVRVPSCEVGIISRILDAGAYGIIAPMINTRAEAETFVGYCRYPPMGERSYGPSRAKLYGGEDYFTKANETILTFAMIETTEAIANVDQILSVDGLDGIYIGPGDLSASMGQAPGFDHPPGSSARDAIETALKAVKSAGKFAGIHNATAKYAHEMLALGFNFVSVATELRLLSDKVGQVISEARGTN